MLTVTTWNVNGVRARKDDVCALIERDHPDVLCLQEIKATADKVPELLVEHPEYWCYWHGSGGYSGVALLLRRARFSERPRFAHPPFDHETRIVTAEAAGLTFSSIYVPNGGKDFAAKLTFLEALVAYADDAARAGRELLMCGDLNVAREPRDVHPSLQKPDLIGTTPDERALFARLLAAGYADLGRRFAPDDDRLFTWWAPWRNLREKNIGWRIDYTLASRALAERAVSCSVERSFGKSDHGPLSARFDL